MKAKILFLAILCAVLASTSLVWAASNPSQDATVAQTAPEVTMPDANPTAAQLLDELTTDATELGACCVADCFDAWAECLTECGADPSCRQDCRADRRACTRTC